jgi:TRAP-type mannitol/chloroaromatic compound transport system permease small subunit
MTVLNYLLIGVVFMFLVEYALNTPTAKKYSKIYPNLNNQFGFWERIIGILFWPVCLGIFLYNFFKEYFK